MLNPDQLRDLAHYAEKLREMEDGPRRLNLRSGIQVFDPEDCLVLGEFHDDEGKPGYWEFLPYEEPKPS